MVESSVIVELARRYSAAEDERVPIEPITTSHPGLTEVDAYRVQMAIVATKVHQGNKIVGKKVGATSEVIQKMLGITEPVYGHLFDYQQVQSGGTIPRDALIQPRVECEIAFIMTHDLVGPDITAADVLNAAETVMASLEINDPRTRDWNLGLCEAIADNGVAGRFVLGAHRVSPRGLDLSMARAAFFKNGEKIAEGEGAAVLGDPTNAVVWLANMLAEHRLTLREGEIVLTGSLTPVVPAAPGDVFEATIDPLGSVSVRFA